MLETNLNIAKLNNLVYISRDPLDTSYHLFSHSIDFSQFDSFYIYNNGSQKIELIYSWEELTTTTIRIKLDTSTSKFYANKDSHHLIILSINGKDSLDFIDKYGTIGTSYVYKNFSITNSSSLNKQVDINIFSTNLSVCFQATNYPFVFNDTSYIAGYPSPAIHLGISSQYDPNNFWLFKNNKLIGNSNYLGYSSGLSFTNALIELVYKGTIEFSLTQLGPWSSMISILELRPKESKVIYYRCGRDTSTQFKVLNSIKLLSTEAV